MLERPSKLTSYRFDQLADQINQRVMPAEADVERYVGLEHLDPDSLRIRRWGDPSEVESTKLRFEPGDIIFGKRRVYQRKVAVADTEGICSAHAMVLRAKPDTVLPEFLPFFMQSDLFMERALSISVGSLSPTINWKALAAEEFLLPPIQEQARLVEALMSFDSAINAFEDCKDRAWKANLANYDDVVGREVSLFHPDQDDARRGKGLWEVVPLRDAVSIENNFRKPISAAIRERMQGDFPYYGATGEIDRINEYRFDGEYSLIGEDGDHFLKYLTQPMTQYVSGKFNVNNHAHAITGTERCLTEWFDRYYRYRNIRVWLTKQGASRLKLKKDTLVSMPIALPSIVEQRQLIKRLDATENAVKQIEARLGKLLAVRKHVLEKAAGEPL